MTSDGYSIGTIPVTGCMTDRLTLTASVPPDQVPAIIERDRVIMAARPGMHLKLLPLLMPDANTVLSGGAYLFDTIDNAGRFEAWVLNEFELDGVLFPDRPMFQECSSKVWEVIAAENFQDMHTQQGLMRIEEWRFNGDLDQESLEDTWPSIRGKAIDTNLSSAWLLLNVERGEISTVTTMPSASASGDSPQPDIDGLMKLAALPSIGAELETAGVEKIFDRTSFIYTVWFPVTQGGNGKLPLFPNSPPFPAP